MEETKGILNEALTETASFSTEETEELDTLNEGGGGMPNSSTLAKIGEQNKKLTFNGVVVGERPTETVELGDSTYIFSNDGGSTAVICSWDELLPVGTEIKEIQLYAEEYGWFDLRDAIALDPNNRVYTANVHKVFTHAEQAIPCYGVVGNYYTGCFVADLALANTLTNAKITYYTDTVVKANE